MSDHDDSEAFTSRSTSRSVSFIEKDEEKHFFSQLPAMFAHKAAIAPQIMSPDERDLVGLASVDHMPKRQNAKIAWPNGQVYTGPMKQGHPHGVGSLILKSGLRVQSRWQNGRFVGFVDADAFNLSAADVSPLPEQYSDDDTHGGTSRLQSALKASFGDELHELLGALATHHNKAQRFEDTIAWPNGQMFRGGLKDGRPHGEGIVRLPSGLQIPSFWSRGKLIKAGVHDPSDALKQQVKRFPEEENQSDAFFNRSDLMKATKTLLTRQEKTFSVYALQDQHLVGGGSLLVWPNGQIYRGGFRNGQPHGYGEVLPGGGGERVGTFWSNGQVVSLYSDRVPKSVLASILPTSSDPLFSGVSERTRPALPLSGPANKRTSTPLSFLQRFFESKQR